MSHNRFVEMQGRRPEIVDASNTAKLLELVQRYKERLRLKVGRV